MNNPKSDLICTPEAVLSFPCLFTPRQALGSTVSKYSCTLVFPAGTDLSQLEVAFSSVHQQAFPGQPVQKKPFGDGNQHLEWGDCYKDAAFLRISSINRPAIVGPDKADIIDERLVYAGCYVRAIVRAYAYNASGNRGVAFGLEALQVLRDGVPISGSKAAAGLFSATGPALGGAPAQMPGIQNAPAGMFGAAPARPAMPPFGGIPQARMPQPVAAPVAPAPMPQPMPQPMAAPAMAAFPPQPAAAPAPVMPQPMAAPFGPVVNQ